VGWRISNPYANYYELVKGVYAYHTGIDVLLQHGSSLGQAIYALASGVVTFARRVPNSTWGNLLVISHEGFYSRYGHDNDFLVEEGDIVSVGQPIAHVGDAFGVFAPHLHFDISLTEVLKTHPADWPGLDLERLRVDYTDPIVFMRGHQMATVIDQISAHADAIKVLAVSLAQPTVPSVLVQALDDGTNLRIAPAMSGSVQAKISKGTVLNVLPAGSDGTNSWYKIVDGQYSGLFVRQDVVGPKA
jgi:hypothetical protein